LNDVCTLKVEKGKVQKSYYTTEQDIICVPQVRLPWQKCKPVPTCSKTRTITLLKEKTYECEVCKYSWEVLDPPVPDVGQTQDADADTKTDSSDAETDSGDAKKGSDSEQPPEPKVEPLEFEDPTGSPESPITPGVPKAPPVPATPPVPTTPPVPESATLPFETVEPNFNQAELKTLPLIYDRR